MISSASMHTEALFYALILYTEKEIIIMETIKGTYTSAQIFTTNNKETAIDPYAIAQLQMICDQESARNCRIRVMPDVHPGKVDTVIREQVPSGFAIRSTAHRFAKDFSFDEWMRSKTTIQCPPSKRQ